MEEELFRLQKIIADRGYCSRRRAEELISSGLVKVDGQTVTELGSKFTSDIAIEIAGRELKAPEKKHYTYLLINKPLGVVTTLQDDRGRPTVGDLIPARYPRLFPVGRLDINTTGLLLLTDDGEFANLVMHPSSELEKSYQAKVVGRVNEDELNRLRRGIRLEDGLTAPAKARALIVTDDYSLLEITIHEGKKREVRRMMEAIGHNVISLTRTRIGPIELKLKKGEIAEANSEDIAEIKRICLNNRNKHKGRF